MLLSLRPWLDPCLHRGTGKLGYQSCSSQKRCLAASFTVAPVTFFSLDIEAQGLQKRVLFLREAPQFGRAYAPMPTVPPIVRSSGIVAPAAVIVPPAPGIVTTMPGRQITPVVAFHKWYTVVSGTCGLSPAPKEHS